MSPRRWGLKTRLWAYRYLCLRDGEACRRCGRIPTTRNTLDIDHINGDPTDDHPDNLRLLCRSCNVAIANGSRIPSDQRERERAEGNPATRVARTAVDYTKGSAELHANLLYELSFRSWLLQAVFDQGSLEKADALAAGAELVGCSPSTTAKYLTKLTSSAGPLEEVRGALGETLIIPRPHLDQIQEGDESHANTGPSGTEAC